MLFFGEINSILLLNFLEYFFEAEITDTFLSFIDKKFETINKFFSTPPPSIEGIKIINFLYFISLKIV